MWYSNIIQKQVTYVRKIRFPNNKCNFCWELEILCTRSLKNMHSKLVGKLIFLYPGKLLTRSSNKHNPLVLKRLILRTCCINNYYATSA